MSIKKKSLIIWLAFLCFAVAAEPQLDKATDRIAPVNDGPYIFIEEDKLKSLWLCDGEIKKEVISLSSLPKTFSRCGLSAEVSDLSITTQHLEYHGNFQVAALSDLHGQFDLMITLLTNNNIIDQQGNWAFGEGHFVIAGDVFNRGDKVTEILWFLYRLERQAKRAGGRVHLLLGNHEVMVLNNNLRYLHEKYHNASALLKHPFADLFAENTVLGSWLRSKPVLIKINNQLFVHAGIAPSLIEISEPLASINSIFKSHLVESELDKPREGVANYLHKRDGPIWYRGYFKMDGASTAEVDSLLQHFQVSHIVVGHTSQDKIETRHQGKIIAIDSSIKKGKYGELLFAHAGKMWRGTLSGEKLALE